MEFERPTILANETVEFLEKFNSAFIVDKNIKKDNDKTVQTALIYEKIRVALEYQEEHLIFKNAVSRILRRKYTISPNLEAKELVSDMLNEMAWANYLNMETLKPEAVEAITTVTERYLVLLKYAQSGRFKRQDLVKMVIDWLSCEIDNVLRPEYENDILLNYTYNMLKPNLDLTSSRVSEFDNEVQLKISIYILLLKPDYPLVQFWALKTVYSDWDTKTTDEMKKIARSFDPYYNKIDRALNHPLRKNYLSFTKRYIAPFVVLRSVLVSQGLNIEKIKSKPGMLFDMMMSEYENLVQKGRSKVWRGTMRALFFILMTKVTLAFIIEAPFDRMIAGKVDYLSLIINVSLPPILMFIAGTFVKSPPKKNYILVANAIASMLSKGKIEDKPFSLIRPKNSSSFLIFNLFYSLLTLSILAAVIWLLVYLRFNIVSIFFFFFFVSVVSFFSFRIRNIALELAMKRTKDDAITSIVELIFLPFIRIGRAVSDKFAAFNPLILFLDFIIEAPMKTIIKILNSWFKFVNTKKEELEF
jgi:hypothetical protein